MGPLRPGNCRALVSTLVALLASVGVNLHAQAGATTLQSCTDAATRIVVARAVERIDDSARGRTQLRFVVEEVLRGSRAPSLVTLEEASGAACGRALFAVVPGVRRILFLDGSADTPRLVRLGARAVPDADRATVEHVDGLVRTANNPAARRRLLVDALDDLRPRIRDDAARALAATPALGTAGGSDAARLLAALDRAFEDPSIDPTPLWIAATRCDPQATLGRLCDGYLHTSRNEILSLLEGALLAGPAESLADCLVPALAHEGADVAARRAAVLLRQLGPSSARSRIARALLASSDRGIAVQAAEVLLDDATPDAWLHAMVAPDVLRDAARAHSTAAPAAPPTRWRSIDPERLR